MTATGKGHKAQRTCLGCREALDQDQLVRYVLAPDGTVTVDYRHRLPGRGAYTCLKMPCLATAVQRKQFDRAFKGTNAPVELAALRADILRQLREKVLNLVGMGRKSSNLVSGSNSVLAALDSSEPIGLLLLADDISEGVASRILTRADRHGVAHVRMFDKDLLGQVAGKGERSIVGIKAGRLAQALKVELLRYENIAGES